MSIPLTEEQHTELECLDKVRYGVWQKLKRVAEKSKKSSSMVTSTISVEPTNIVLLAILDEKGKIETSSKQLLWIRRKLKMKDNLDLSE